MWRGLGAAPLYATGLATLPSVTEGLGDVMEDELFQSSRIKIERAKGFVLELERELADYIASDPLQATIDTSRSPPAIKLEFAAITQIPGAIVGDAVHNMRTALDLMASEMARINNETDSDIYFPFAASAEALEAQLSAKNFAKAGDDAVRLIRDLKPYKGGNDLLRALHDMDILDKHRALVLVGSTFGAEIAGSYSLDDPNNGEITVESDVSYIFPEGTWLAGKFVIDTLKELVKLIESIVEQFTALVQARS